MRATGRACPPAYDRAYGTDRGFGQTASATFSLTPAQLGLSSMPMDSSFSRALTDLELSNVSSFLLALNEVSRITRSAARSNACQLTPPPVIHNISMMESKPLDCKEAS